MPQFIPRKLAAFLLDDTFINWVSSLVTLMPLLCAGVFFRFCNVDKCSLMPTNVEVNCISRKGRKVKCLILLMIIIGDFNQILGQSVYY